MSQPESSATAATASGKSSQITQALLDYGTVLALLLLSVVIAFLSPVFLTVDNLLQVLLQAAINLLIALGMTFVILTGGIALAVGSTAALAGLTVAAGMKIGVAWPLAIVAALIVGLVVGLINGLLISKLGIIPFIVTLGMLSVVRGTALVTSDGRPVFGFPETFNQAIGGTLGSLPMPVLIATESGNYAIGEAGRLGFDLIEIPMIKPYEFDAASHQQALKQANIQPTCSLALPRHLHMPHNPTGAHEFLRKALEQVEAVGSHYLGGCIGYSLGVLTGAPPTAAERQTVIDVLKEVAAEAKARGITLALEPCNRYETYLYNTLGDVRDAIHAIGADNLKLHADTYQMNIEELGYRQPIIEAGDVLDYVHMSESHRGLVGSGTIHWPEIWAGLAAIRFQGFLVLESFAAINPDLAAATCLWRPPTQSSETIAREGLAFLRRGVQEYGL